MDGGGCWQVVGLGPPPSPPKKEGRKGKKRVKRKRNKEVSRHNLFFHAYRPSLTYGGMGMGVN